MKQELLLKLNGQTELRNKLLQSFTMPGHFQRVDEGVEGFSLLESLTYLLHKRGESISDLQHLLRDSFFEAYHPSQTICEKADIIVSSGMSLPSCSPLSNNQDKSLTVLLKGDESQEALPICVSRMDENPSMTFTTLPGVHLDWLNYYHLGKSFFKAGIRVIVCFSGGFVSFTENCDVQLA